MPMKSKPEFAVFFIALGLFFSSCDFPYQPKQFILPENPFKFPASHTVKGFADSAKNVKFAFTLMEGGARWVYYVDFNDTAPRPIKLKKPAGKQNLHADSPLISPDGSHVTYFLTQGGATINGAYIQKLDPAAEPVLVAGNGTEPHWFVNSRGETFVVYSDNMYVSGELSTGLGKTYWKKVNLSGTGSLSESPAEEIAPYPMNGGLSKNGQFLCTGYHRAAFYDIKNSRLTLINSSPAVSKVCNPSICPDSSRPDWMMFLNFSGPQNLINPFSHASDYPAFDSLGSLPMHEVIFIVDAANTVKDFIPLKIMKGSYLQWQDPEWSNNPRFLAALALINESQAELVMIKNIGDGNKTKDRMILTIGAGKLNDTSTPFVWIEK